MNVTKFANLFSQGVPWNCARNQVLAQPPAGDALQRLSEHLLAAKERGQDLQKRFDTLELSVEAMARDEDSALGELPDEFLKIYLNMYKTTEYLSQQSEASLLEYRDQLSAFDETIQEYQDMLSGKAERGTMRAEDVSSLLEQTKAARERFLQEGAKRLNVGGVTASNLSEGACRIASDGKLAGATSLEWSVDAASENIYEEIDRAIDSARHTASLCQSGAARIEAELERRHPKTELLLQPDEPGAVPERPSIFRDLYEDIRNCLQSGSLGEIPLGDETSV